MEGYVFNIQRFSVHDGIGIRTNVFLKGCPLSCIWCHNPEGSKVHPQIQYSLDKCISCGACVAVCPRGAHRMENGVHFMDFERCGSCMRCAENICVADAIQAVGTLRSVSSILDEVLRDKKYYEKSGGGMTLSGGEPFFQPEFALELLKRARELGINTAVETCGMAQDTVFERAAQYTDQFLFDYKVTGEELHKKVTGVSGIPILKNLALLDDLSANIILRCPMIPGINDNDEHYRGIAEIVKKHKSIREIHIMPYHSLGNGKRTKLGMEIPFCQETMKYDRAEEIKKEIEGYTPVLVKVI